MGLYRLSETRQGPPSLNMRSRREPWNTTVPPLVILASTHGALSSLLCQALLFVKGWHLLQKNRGHHQRQAALEPLRWVKGQLHPWYRLLRQHLLRQLLLHHQPPLLHHLLLQLPRRRCQAPPQVEQRSKRRRLFPRNPRRASLHLWRKLGSTLWKAATRVGVRLSLRWRPYCVRSKSFISSVLSLAFFAFAMLPRSGAGYYGAVEVIRSHSNGRGTSLGWRWHDDAMRENRPSLQIARVPEQSIVVALSGRPIEATSAMAMLTRT